MEDVNIREQFTARHHALLFAWMAREVVVRVGETTAAPVLRAAVRSYGEQRGHRMALRAQQDGQPLSMAVYLSYREWQAGAGEMQQTGVCPWHGSLPPVPEPISMSFQRKDDCDASVCAVRPRDRG